MTQNLNMRSFRIEQLGTPLNEGDATTRQYVDTRPTGMLRATADTLYLGLGGASLSGGLHMTDASKITNLGNPSVAADAANKRYVDSKVVSSGGITQLTADNRYLSLNGGGLRGNLNMNNKKVISLASPTANTDAANKQYVDSRPSGGISQANADARYLLRVGGALNGELSMGYEKITDPGQPGNANDVVTKAYLDSEIGKAPTGGELDPKS